MFLRLVDESIVMHVWRKTNFLRLICKETTKKKEVDADAEKMAVMALTSLIYDGVTDRNVWNSVITNYLAHKLPL